MNSDGEQNTVLRGDNNSNTGYGVNTIDYNNTGDASLQIPNVPNGNYGTTIHWTLSTNMGSYNNDSD